VKRIDENGEADAHLGAAEGGNLSRLFMERKKSLPDRQEATDRADRASGSR